MRKKHIHLLIGVVIIALSLFYAFRGVKFDELLNAFTSVHYFYVLPAIFMVLVSFLLRAIRWRYLIRPVKEVKTTELLSPLMVGFMANMLPARAGEFVRAYLLSKKVSISLSSSLATIFIERLFDLFLVLFLLVWVLLFMPDAITSGNAGGAHELSDKIKIFGKFSFTLFLFIFLFSALLQFKNNWAMTIIRIFIKPFPPKWREKTITLVNSFAEGLNIIRDKRGFIATIFLSFIIWISFALTYYLLYMGFGIETMLPVISSLVILCLIIAVFITVAPTPGFLGSYHLACVATLHGVFGIQKAVALSYGIVAWLVAMGPTIIIGAIFAIKENISFSEFSSNKEKTTKQPG